jgi:hypothetical protein
VAPFAEEHPPVMENHGAHADDRLRRELSRHTPITLTTTRF